MAGTLSVAFINTSERMHTCYNSQVAEEQTPAQMQYSRRLPGKAGQTRCYFPS